MTTIDPTIDPTAVALAVARRAFGDSDAERVALVNVRHAIARESARTGPTPFLAELADIVAGIIQPSPNQALDYEQLLEQHLTLLAQQS